MLLSSDQVPVKYRLNATRSNVSRCVPPIVRMCGLSSEEAHTRVSMGAGIYGTQARTQPFSKGGNYMAVWLRQVCCGH